MKLILTIVNHDDANTVTQALIKKDSSSTKLATTGGFLMAGNVAILISMDEEKVQTVVDIIREHFRSRKQMIPIITEMSYDYYPSMPVGVVVNGATIFAMDIERFERVRVFINLTRLAGNAPLKRQLELETAWRGLSHAYILSGPAGSGKRTLVGLLAAALVCDRQGGALPCLSCADCRKAEGGIRPDIVRVGDDGRGINVAQVCTLHADACIRPSEAECKVYILENAQTMSASAQNAILKLLEEGPAYTTFLLLTDSAAALLPTVRPRREHLLPSPVTQREAELWLDEHYPGQPQVARQAVADHCEGLLDRVAIELERQAAGDTQALGGALELVRRLAGGDELALLEHCVALGKWDRGQPHALLGEGVLLLRDALVYSIGTLRESGPRQRGAAECAARALFPRQLTQAVGVLERLHATCGSSMGAGHLVGWLGAALNTL